MDEEEKKIIKSFELHARSPDKVPFIMAREQLRVLEKMQKTIDDARKEIVQLRADVSQELRNRMDDGK